MGVFAFAETEVGVGPMGPWVPCVPCVPCVELILQDGKKKVLLPHSNLGKAPKLEAGDTIRVLPGESLSENGKDYCREGDDGIVASIYKNDVGEDRFGVYWRRTNLFTHDAVSGWPTMYELIEKAVTKFGFTTGEKVQVVDSGKMGMVIAFTTTAADDDDVELIMYEGDMIVRTLHSNLGKAPNLEPGSRTRALKAVEGGF